MKTKKDFYYQASGFILTENLTYEETQTDDLTQYPWEAFEFSTDKELAGMIDSIAVALYAAYYLGKHEK